MAVDLGGIYLSAGLSGHGHHEPRLRRWPGTQGGVCRLRRDRCRLLADRYADHASGRRFTYAAVTLRIAVASGTAFLTRTVGGRHRIQFTAWRALVACAAGLDPGRIGAGHHAVLYHRILGFGHSSALVRMPRNSWAWEPEAIHAVMGPMAPLWVTLAFADWLVKLSLALIALIPFKVIVTRLTAQAA